jgi:DNA modification methylase
VVQRTGNIVRAGNGRVEAAKALGWTHIAAVVVDDESADAVAYAIADNRTAELAEWDNETLATLLDTLPPEMKVDTGFTDADLAELLDGLTPEITEDEVPEPPKVSVSRAGDLWVLGDHRVLCGDSTKAEDVARVMGGAKADLCFTSPPYALGKSIALSNNKSMSVKGSAYDIHDDDAASWESLMYEWWEQSLNAVSVAWLVNVQPLAGNKRYLMQWIANRVNRLIDIITWDKGHAAPQMASGVLASRYEWIIALGKDGASRAFPMSTWKGTLQSIYEAPPQRNNEYYNIHAATMPIHVPAWAIGTLCDQCKSVYEPFCGSGTTLIAAEQLGRKCYGIEISPQYVDVIVTRWQTLTGKQATLEGKTWDEVKAERGAA